MFFLFVERLWTDCCMAASFLLLLFIFLSICKLAVDKAMKKVIFTREY